MEEGKGTVAGYWVLVTSYCLLVKKVTGYGLRVKKVLGR